MKSRTSERFRDAFSMLPEEIKQRSHKAFALWKSDPSHPSLKFRQISPKEHIYSVRIRIGWRALGVREGDTITWFWIGSHAVYDRLVSRL
ncbi:MAG TPA: hypothetical protein VES59_04000 [Bacteroidota bacterium]|nr:hypothetical protein [Bacteroidota bacterium]